MDTNWIQSFSIAGFIFHFSLLQIIFQWIQLSSDTQPCPTLCDPMNHSMPGLPVHHQLPEFTQIHVHWVGDAIQPSHSLSSPVVPFSSCLQSFPTSGSFQMSQLFASGGQNIGSFSFNISPSNEHPWLISFRMDWVDLLEVQGTLTSLFQHHSSKASIVFYITFNGISGYFLI